MTKFIREIQAGDSILDSNGTILDVMAIHPLKENSTLFAITFFNQESQEDNFCYLHANSEVEMIGSN